ncbi:MAG: O-antigen ligase family protein [Verrucomicrobiaceae bacterium]|nr:O-antigen ligase family protein [Verrucomicrobiaceae bacterium]
MAFLTVLLLLAVGNLAVGLIHFGGNWDFHVVPQFVRSFEAGRIGGFYNNPNHLAAFFSLVVFTGLGQLCFGRGSATWRLVLGFVIVSATLGMALTISRGALLALGLGGAAFAGMGTWMVWKCHRYLAGRLLSACVVLGLVLGAVLWKVNEDYLRKRVVDQSASQDVRADIWKAALMQHGEQPLIGTGARSFYDGGVRYRQPGVAAWIGEPEFVHNEYLQALADYGWIGLGLLLVALGAHLQNGWSYVRWYVKECFPRTGSLLSARLALVIGALSAVFASAVHAFVEFQWHVGGLAVLTAALAGILANPGFEREERVPIRILGVRPALKFTWLAYSVCLVAGSVVWGRADWIHAKGLIQAEQGELESALASMERAGVLDPQSAGKAVDRADVSLQLQMQTESGGERKRLLDEVRADLEQAAVRNPFDFLTATSLSDVYMAFGQPEKALSEIRRALSLAPMYEEPRLALALFHHRRQEFRQAEEAYLWASKAGAANAKGTVTWLTAYRQLLMDVGSLPAAGAGDP